MRTVLRNLVLAAAVAAVGLAAANVSAASIGLNFTGANQRNTDNSSFAADTMGAVGRDHIVEMLNGVYTVYDKATGQQLQRMNLNTFWREAGRRGPETLSPDHAIDSRVLYDPTTDHWYAISLDCCGKPGVFLGVSVSADPTFPPDDLTRGWKGLRLDVFPSGAPLVNADYPSLGFDADGVYITSVNINNNPRTYSIVSLPKADLLTPTPTLANRSSFVVPGADDYAQGAVTNMQPVVHVGPSNGTASVFLANGRLGLKRWDLAHTGVQSPGQATLSPAANIAIEPFVGPPYAAQPDNAPPLDSFGVFTNASGMVLDRGRLQSNLVQQGDSVWGTHTVDVDGRSGIRWYELDDQTGDVRQFGTITDPLVELISPSLAVNPYGDVVIGFTGTGENKFPSAYAVVGSTVAGTTSFGNLMELKAGAGTHTAIDDSGRGDRNRWGDYSATMVDPSNPFSFWTFQEFAQPANQWAVQISQIVVSGPVTRTEIVGPTAMTAVRDTDSDALFDNLGDTATAVLGIGSARVGEVDPATGSNLVERLVAKFSLPSEPGLADRLETATLRFYLQQKVGTPAGPLSLLHSTSDNDLDRLASDFEDASYNDTELDLIQPTGPATAYYELDVTDQVLADYASDGTNPLSAFRLQISELTFLEDNIGRYYVLGTGAGTTNPPRLTLTFIQVPEPPRSLLAALALLGLIGCVSRRAKPQNRRRLAHFAESAEQNVPVPLPVPGSGRGCKESKPCI